MASKNANDQKCCSCNGCDSDIFNESQVKEFVITGASKRGWATWTTAAVDNRVKAIMPMVIDLLNIKPSFEHHWGGLWFLGSCNSRLCRFKDNELVGIT